MIINNNDFFYYSGVSHSMMSDMQVIDQETPASASSSSFSNKMSSRPKFESFFDEFEIVETSTGLEG